MTALEIHCLGAFAVRLHEAAITTFPTDKIRALLTYLALEIGQPHRREVLANLLWPELDESGALLNLRLTLHRLRKTLDTFQPGIGVAVLESTRQTMQVNPALVTVDVNRFQALLTACAVHVHERLLSCPACRTRLQQAVDLYRGELLAGFGLADAPAFEEWLLLRRESLHQQALAALHTLVLGYEQQGDDVQAHHYASRQLALDPTREEAHRQLIRSLRRRGLRSAALAQYESCRRILQIELGVAPAPETVALYEQLLATADDQVQGRVEVYPAQPSSTAALSTAALSTALPEWHDVPEVHKIYGRETELAQLCNWLVYEHCALVTVLGIGGVGKTTLAAVAVKTVATNFARVIWRSLLNAPPLEELLRELLQRLSNEQLIDLPQGLDGQLLLLLDALRRQRSLLILDNLESIMHPDQPGQMRPDYAGYAQLLRCMATQRHQSSLLLTSRERPQDVARWEEDTPRVRTLLLGGLDETAGQIMLTARGLLSPQADAIALVHRYSGNPLALRLVAQTVQDLFGGSIAAFLATETALFADIQAVLDQQFTRLAPLEQELLLWLAIEREPVTLQTLRDNLIAPGAPRTLVEALRALQRRSLIGQSAQHFVLQNVVIEYLTEHLVAQVYGEICDFNGGNLDDDLTVQAQSQALTAQIQNLGLNRFALLKATAKEYVRVSQERLIVQPLLKRLLQKFGQAALVKQLSHAVTTLRTFAPLPPGYMAGNLLNLLLHLGVDLRGYDFSYLPVWQANLQMMRLPEVKFRGANLAHANFTHLFGEIFTLQFQQGTQVLVTGSVDGSLYVWGASTTAATGVLLYEYQTFGAGATIASFDASGCFLASGHTDNQVRLWDVTQGRLLHALAAPIAAVWYLLFSPTAKTLAVSSADGTIRLCDVQTGQLQVSWRAHRVAIPALAFRPDGRILASSDVDGTICLWRITEDSQVVLVETLQGHTDEVHNLAFDPSGTLLVSSSHDTTVRLWRVSTTAGTQLLHTLQGHAMSIRALAISPDGALLASGGEDTYIRLWDLQTGQLLHTFFDLGYPSGTLVFSQDGSRLASAAREQIVFLWEVATRQRLNSLQAYSNQFYAARFSPDGRWLAGGGVDGALHLWTITPHPTDNNTVVVAPAQSLRGHMRPLYAIAIAPDVTATHPLVASASADQTIRLWDTASSRTLTVLAGHTDKVEAVAFSPDGQSLVSAGRDKGINLWDVTKGELRHTLHGHTDRVLACSFSPTGRLIASGGIDRTVRVWDAHAGRALHTLQGHQNAVRAVLFSRDGTLLISSSYDHTLRFWAPDTGQQLDAVATWATSVLSIDAHPQMAVLALGANDHLVRLWALGPRPGEGRLLAMLHGHTNSVLSVQFSPDGRWLVSASADETIRLWSIASLLAIHFAETQLAPESPSEPFTVPCVAILRAEGPYAGMDITGVTGISAAQKATLKALGAVEDELTI